jgi:hypothetical protein
MEEERTAKPVDAVRQNLIRQRTRIIASIETYIQSGRSKAYFIQVLKPMINSFYLTVRPEFVKKENLEKINQTLKSENVQLILDLFYKIDDWASQKKLISFDSEKVY